MSAGKPVAARSITFEPTLGAALPERSFGPVSRTAITRYAGASGDFHPAHTDEEYARATGAPSVFVMGMLPGGYVARFAEELFGTRESLREIKLRFVTRTWPGDEIVCSGRVAAVEGRRVRVEIEVERRGDGPEGADLPWSELALKGHVIGEISTIGGE